MTDPAPKSDVENHQLIDPATLTGDSVSGLSYTVTRTSWATALATFGVQMFPLRQLILQSTGEARDWNSEREYRSYTYTGAVQVPGQYRDKNNTFRAKVNASRLVHDHAMGNLRLWAPNHLWYVMMSAGVNWDRILKDHLVDGNHVELYRVEPPASRDGILPNHVGHPHYQLHIEPAGALSQRALSDLIPVTDEYLAGGLCTAGYSFVPDKSELRKNGDGSHSWRLWFDPDEGPGRLPQMIAMLQQWRAGVESGIADGTFVNAMYGMQYLRNRVKLLSGISTSAAQMIFSAPGAIRKSNRKAQGRLVQISEAGFARNSDGMIDFFKR